MKLSFKRCLGYGISRREDIVLPITEDGQEIEDVVSCSVTSGTDVFTTMTGFTTMTLTVHVHTSHPEDEECVQIKRKWLEENLTAEQYASLIANKLTR